MSWCNMSSEANQNTGYPHFKPHTGLPLNNLLMLGLAVLCLMQKIKDLFNKKIYVTAALWSSSK